MHRQVTVPVSEIAGMKPTHVSVLIGLLSYANIRTGKCWPALRTLAETVGMSLSRVQRAIVEMEAAGYLTRRRRIGSSCIYHVAKRFLPVFRERNTDSPEPPPCPSTCPQPPRSAGETKGGAKKDKQLRIRERDDSEQRFAPPPTGPNPFARKRWLDKLHGFACQHVRGDTQWEAWALIDKARSGLLDRAEQRTLNKLDLSMRATGYRLPVY